MPRPPIQRFMEKIHDDDGHWLWMGYIAENGYGHFYPGGPPGMVYAHRWAFEHFIRPLEEGEQVDHLCRVRHCVTPSCMEAVTQRENLLRGDTFARHNSEKTHCVHGHLYDEENTVWTQEGWRACRTCRNEHNRRWRQERG